MAKAMAADGSAGAGARPRPAALPAQAAVTVRARSRRLRQWPARPPTRRRAPASAAIVATCQWRSGRMPPRCAPASASRRKPASFSARWRSTIACGDVARRCAVQPGVRRGRHDGVVVGRAAAHALRRAARPRCRPGGHVAVGGVQRRATTARSARGRWATGTCGAAQRVADQTPPSVTTTAGRQNSAQTTSTTSRPAAARGPPRRGRPARPRPPRRRGRRRPRRPSAQRPYLDVNSRVGRTCPCSQNRRWRPS